jgi:hypothetical protein
VEGSDVVTRAFVLACCALAGCTILNSRDGLSGRDTSQVDDESMVGDESPSSEDGGSKPPDHDAAVHGDGDGDGDDDASVDEGAEPDGSVDEPDASDAGVDPGPTALYTGQLLPTGIALRDGEVCWVGGVQPRALYCGSRNGRIKRRTVTVDGDLDWLGDTFDLAFDDSHVYWSNGSANQVVKRSLAGGAPEQYFTGGGRIGYLAQRGGRMFATNYQISGDAAGHGGSDWSGYVIYGPYGHNGQESQLIYPGESHAGGIAVVNNTVFWGTSHPHQLAFGDHDGNAQVTRINTDGGVTGVAVDSEKVAYFIVGNRRIFRLQPGADTTEPMYEADAPFGTSDLALDDGWLYWTERDRGNVMRMRR